MTIPAPTTHATCVALGTTGVLIRGASGAGKSALAAELIGQALALGWFAALVADDRVALAAVNDRLLGRTPPQIAGLIERRGLGVVAAPHVPAVVIALVVDILPQPAPRMPTHEQMTTSICGLALPRLAVAGDAQGAASLAFAALKALATSDWRSSCDRTALAFAAQHEKLMV
jgi:HPr kinase/phosphorylase